MESRNYGIDLLRLVLMFMVCLLHVLLQGGALGACSVGTARHGTFLALQTLSYSAVNAFGLISGYMSGQKPQKHSKTIFMWFQVVFYSFVLTAVFCAAGLADWNFKNLIKAAFPVTTGYYWYYTAFFATGFFAPIIQKYVYSIRVETAQKTFLVFALLFSIVETLNYAFKTLDGYSTIWLVVLYLLGALAKKIQLFHNQSTPRLIALFVCCNALTWALYEFCGRKQLLHYISPTVLLSAFILVVLFSRLKLKGRIVKRLSPLAFGVYLFQLNKVVWQNLSGAVAPRLSDKTPLAALQVIFYAAVLFLSGLTVELFRQKAAKLFRLQALSCRLEKLASGLLGRLLYLLR